MSKTKLELRTLKLDESDLKCLFLLEVSDGLWSFTTDALDEQRETFGRALNYWVEKNPDNTKVDLRPFQPLLCFHVSKMIFREFKIMNLLVGELESGDLFE